VDADARTITAVLSFLVCDLRRAAWLQDVHRDDGTGACRGCCRQTARILHPCLLRDLADEAMTRRIPMQRGVYVR
jgi:hypothetical protein